MGRAAKGGFARKTAGGYDTYEVVSALQKAIRRSQPELAMHWCLELASVGLLPWAAQRLRVIAYEDVGLADPEAVTFALQALDYAVAWYKAKSGSYHLALSNAVLSLAGAKKSRVGDMFHAAVRGRRAGGWHPEIPDEALDKHTRRGQKMGRDMAHFLDDAALLVPSPDYAPCEKAWEKEARAWWLAGRPGADVTTPWERSTDGGQPELL